MDPAVPSIAEVRGMLVALQKNLECPICLEVMKEPVSTNCAHIFCRFCTLKLLGQKKGVAQCPLCNARVTKRSLREDVRFKQVIKAVLEIIHAFEHDTGLKFSDEQCFPKKAIGTAASAVPQSEQLVIDSKGYRGRLKRAKAGKKGITNLEGEKANMPLCDRTVTRYSLRKKSSSSKTIVLDVGSDSSEDVFKKMDTERNMGLGKNSPSPIGGGSTKNQRTDPCLVELPEPRTEDGASLNIPGTEGFLEEGLPSIEDARDSRQRLEDRKENVAVEKSQDFSSPHSGVAQLGRKRDCSSVEEHGSCSILGVAHLGGEVAESTTDQHAEGGAEGADAVHPDESGQIWGERTEQVLPSQSSAGTPFSPMTGKRLRRSIQKVHDWLSKSQEVLASSPPRDAPSAEVDWDLSPTHLSDADSSVSRTIEPGEQHQHQQEITGEREDDKHLFRPTASKLEDQVFGRTYKRERKSNPLRNERERTHIQAEESTAANTKPCGTLMRRSTARKRKATAELTPEDFIKRQGAEGSRKRLVGEGRPSLDVCGQACTLVDDGSAAEQKAAELPSELPAKEGPSILEAHGSEEPQSWSESDLNARNRKTKTLRGRTLSKSFGTLELIVDAGSGSPEMARIQGEVEEPSDMDTGQKTLRRSRRLQLLTEGAGSGDQGLPLPSKSTGRPSEPTKRENKQEDGRVKTRRGSQAPSPSATDGPRVWQGPLPRSPSHADASPRDMEEKEGKTRAKPASSPQGTGVGKGASVEQTPEGLGPCCPDPRAGSQGSCSLLHFQPPVVKPAAPEDKELTPHPSEKGAPAGEGDGPSTGDGTRSCKPPETADKTAAAPELNPETDDSEVDTTGFMRKVFSFCKRQSFLLHGSPGAASATEIQRNLSIGRIADRRLHCIKTPAPNEEGKEAVACGENSSVQRLASPASDFPEPENRSEHSQLASQTPSPDLLYEPLESASKDAKGRNRPPSQKLATDRTAPLELGGEPASPNGDGNSRSPKARRNGSFQRPGSSCVNETNSSMDYFQDAGSGDAQSQGLALSSQRRSSSMGKKQLKSNLEEATDSSSVGVPKCFAPKENLEQGSEEGPRDFEVSAETPDGLLDPINENEGSPKLWEMGQPDVSVLSAKTEEQPPRGRELESSDQSSWSKLKEKGHPVAQRRQARKLPSSGEEESSEDDELPCFQALLFGAASKSLKERETAAEKPALKNTSRSNFSEKDDNICPSQESEGSVNLFSSQSPGSGDSASKPCDSRRSTPSPSPRRLLAIPSGNQETTKSISKASKDAEPLKDGQQEGVNAESNLDDETLGYDSEASHLADSSGLSSQSEILTTQQRDAMQNNLKKLQQEMVDIEAALRQGSRSGAPEEWPLSDEEDDGFTGGQKRLRKGNKVKSTPESKQNVLANLSITIKSTHCTPGNHSTSSSKSKDQIANVLTTKAARRSPGASPGTGRRPSASSHETQGKRASPLTSATYHHARKRNSKSPLLAGKKKMSLVASGLNQGELHVIQRFARKTENIWSNKITEETTHVVMKTDGDLVCERTLKYFLGIAGQKWVVGYQWIEQSLKAGRVLNEEDFEVRGDVTNGRCHQGPKRARESPAGKLFQGLEICCYGPFTDMLPEQLEWMVELSGATLVRQPHLFSCATHAAAAAVVVVQPDAWMEGATCPEFPLHCSAIVVSREWVLDSVACYQRRPLEDYVVLQV